MLHNPKDQGASEDKNNIFYGIDCSYCEADYFGESKRSLKLESNEHKRFVKNFDCKKNKKNHLFSPLFRRSDLKVVSKSLLTSTTLEDSFSYESVAYIKRSC